MDSFLEQHNTIAIIGVGLIGGSLGLALKENTSCCSIIGCEKTQSTIDKAIELGLIDQGTTDIEDATREADIVVICTPLGTYERIAEKIILKKGAILTDAGSVKTKPSYNIFSHLSEKQKPYFVPAHPIAGTEKSGPEAAFSSLFNERKTILTPFEITNSDAVARVKTMWETVGAKIEILDAKLHDEIYASISHVVQLICSCFMVSVSDKIGKKTDENFRRFIRLAGSNPVMWRDIFLENSNNVVKASSHFMENLNRIRNDIEKDSSGSFEENLKESARKRHHLYTLKNGRDFIQPKNAAKKDTIVEEDILPILISSAIMSIIGDKEYKYASGAGLHGLTANLLQKNSINTDDIFQNKQEVLLAIDIFIVKIKTMITCIENNDKQSIMEIMLKANDVYMAV